MDFKLTLNQWLGNGEEVVVFIDANEDIREGNWATLFASCGMRDMNRTLHEKTTPMPATHNRNTNAVPIDGMFTTLPDDGTIRCGYLPFDEGLPGDHRTSWIDIPFLLALGHNPPHLHKADPSPFRWMTPAARACTRKE